VNAALYSHKLPVQRVIAIEIQDENGRTEFEFADPVIIHQLLDASPPETTCLQFIDPYGDTTFNPMQVSVLLGEIESAIPLLPTEEARRRARALLEFVRPVAATSHVYVKFIGD
jgi:hypothetical protein